MYVYSSINISKRWTNMRKYLLIYQTPHNLYKLQRNPNAFKRNQSFLRHEFLIPQKIPFKSATFWSIKRLTPEPPLAHRRHLASLSFTHPLAAISRYQQHRWDLFRKHPLPPSLLECDCDSDFSPAADPFAGSKASLLVIKTSKRLWGRVGGWLVGWRFNVGVAAQVARFPGRSAAAADGPFHDCCVRSRLCF